jgi:hypothetical protein
MDIFALFNRKALSKVGVPEIEGGKKPAEALIVESARLLLESKSDAPLVLHEVEGGFVVQGSTSAVLFADTGDVEIKDAPATAPVAETFDLVKGGKVLVTGDEPAIAKWITEKHSCSLSKALTAEGYTLRPAKTIAVKETEKAVAAAKLKAEAQLPGSALMAVKNAVQSAHDRIQAAIKESILTEAQLDEYMQVAPLVPYEKPLKADDARISIGGCSIYLSNDDFLTSVPHYGVADYVMGLAMKQAIEDGALDAFVKAVRKNLEDSPKVAALDVKLVESEEAPAKVVTESEQVVEGAGKTKVKEASETPESVVIVVSDEAVELRADDEDGELLASSSYNEDDEDSLEAARDEVLSVAKELGYDSEDIEDETDESLTDALVRVVLEDATVMTTPDYAAISEALDAGDAEAAGAALAKATVPVLKALHEGFASKKHVKGRKPSGKTIPRKALMRIKPPVDVGPGRPKSTAAGVEEVVEGKDYSPEEFRAGLKATAKDNLKLMQANADAEKDPVKKKAMLAKIKGIKARYESVTEAWVTAARKMSVAEFASAMLEAAGQDTKEEFHVRVAALVESYASGQGRGDLDRKFTAVNPVIKKCLGKGIDTASIREAVKPADLVDVLVEAKNLDAMLETAKRIGVPHDSSVRISGESVCLRLPRPQATKLVADFPHAKLA